MSDSTNEKEPFNPNPHITKLKSKQGEQDYLEVKWRIVWFRDRYPHGTIDTQEIVVDEDCPCEAEGYAWNNETRRNEKITKRAKGYARFRATVTDGLGGRATGTKTENAANFPDYVEKAETGSIGRAMANLGFGTQFTGDEYDEKDRVVDAPIAVTPAPSPQPDPPPPPVTPPSTPKPTKVQEKMEKKETVAPIPATQSKPTPAPAKPTPKAITALPASTDLIEATRCLLEDAGPYEQQHIFKLAQITEVNQEKSHLWTTEQCDTITTWFDGLSKQHENWLAQTRLQAQHDEVMKQAKDTFGNDAVTALKNTIPGVNGKKLSELTAGQADLLIVKLRNGELVDGKIVDKTETIAITGNAAA